jgi:hypothetical protein
MIAYAPRMSIGQWFKRIFSGQASTDAPLDVAVATDDEKTIDEARIDAGGGGMLGMESHGSPAEEIADSEAEAD